MDRLHHLVGCSHPYSCSIPIQTCQVIQRGLPVILTESDSRLRRPPHLLTLSLLLFTLVSSTTGLIHSYTPHQALAILHLTALYASRLSVPGLAIFLLLLYRSPQYSPTFTVTALLLQKGPLLSLTTLLLLLTPYSPSHFLVFGPTQDVLSLVINSVALIPTLVCLILISQSHNNSVSDNSKNDRKCKNKNGNDSSSQRLRHTTLLILLAVSMFTSIALSLHRFS